MKMDYERIQIRCSDLENQLAEWTEHKRRGTLKEKVLEQESDLYERRMSEMKQDLKEREHCLEECRSKIIQLKEANLTLKEAMGDSQQIKNSEEAQ